MVWKAPGNVPNIERGNAGEPAPSTYQVFRILKAEHREMSSGKEKIGFFLGLPEYPEARANLDLWLPGDGDDEKKSANKLDKLHRTLDAIGVKDIAGLEAPAIADACNGRLFWGRFNHETGQDGKKRGVAEFPSPLTAEKAAKYPQPSAGSAPQASAPRPPAPSAAAAPPPNLFGAPAPAAKRQ